MLNNNSTHPVSAMLSSFGTSAHETGICFSFNSNALRFYSPSGTRRRKASSSAPMRETLCRALLAGYPDIRRIKIKDCGIIFSARIWMRSGRVIHHKAYSLRNLSGILCTKVELTRTLPA